MKRILFLMLILCAGLHTLAQSISLEVDCQNPGWLSNKISYGDQRTIQNLKVKGYINANDLKFIGEMIVKHSLRGSIDLEEANIVGIGTDEDNIMPKDAFDLGDWTYTGGLKISQIKFPLTIVEATDCLHNSSLEVDDIVIGGEAMPIVKSNDMYPIASSPCDGIHFNENVKHITLREGVTEIPDYAFSNGGSYNTPEEKCRFESITFPSTLTKIGEKAFYCCYNLEKVNSIDSLKELGIRAFYKTKAFKDEITVPAKIERFYFNSFNCAKTYYFNKDIKYIVNLNHYSEAGESHDYIHGDKITIHIAAEVPPTVSYYSTYTENFLSNATVYVPKNSVAEYKKATAWKFANILAEPKPATSIDIEEKAVEITKNKTIQLTAIVLPDDADTKDCIWSSSNPDIASVSSTGLVTANSSGAAYIYASLASDKKIIDSCKVVVRQPVTGLQLNEKEKVLKVGDTYTLKAVINPDDADNKNIIWKSDNPTIVSVENGTITALKAGTVNVTATSEEDGNFTDCCVVTVTQPVSGISLDKSEYVLNGIGASFQLTVNVEPEDATNKDVSWKSSNEDVCIVSSGKVVAVGYGTSVILAVTSDGSYMATCTVKVESASGIDNIYNVPSYKYKVYSTDGKASTFETKGVKIVKFPNGKTKKFIIK